MLEIVTLELTNKPHLQSPSRLRWRTMFLDQGRKVSRRNSIQIRFVAVLAAFLTFFLVYLLYLVSRPGHAELQPAALSRSDLLVAMTATTQR